MKLKTLIIFIGIFTLSLHSRSQTILVNWKDSNGKLTWADFSGPVDKTSSFSAYTSYIFNTKYSVKMEANTAIITGFDVVLELDAKNTWAKMDKVTEELLVHEQGHFNIGILAARELIKRVSQTKFTKANFKTQLQRIIDDTDKKYDLLTLKYDKETDHSKNIREQKKWNEFFLKNLAEQNKD